MTSALTTSLACVGDPAPASVGGTITAILAPPAFTRTVSFAVAISGGTASECMVSWGAPLEAVACDGDPQPGGGTFAGFTSPADVDVEVASDRATLAYSGTNADGEHTVYASDGTVVSRIASHGDTVTIGGAPVTLELYDPFLALARRMVVFRSSLIDSPIREGVFFGIVP
jgi:hypothetical protein